MMIRCYRKLYISEKLREKQFSIIKDLTEGKYSPLLYLITPAKSAQNQLEFFTASMLHQDVYQQDVLWIIGLADSYDAAAELVRKITKDVVKTTGGTDIKKYFMAELQ